MQVNAKVDYAVRAVLELNGSSEQFPRKLQDVAEVQAIPLAYLADILGRLRSAGIVRSRRGTDGGYWLGRPAEELDLGRVIRAVEGSLVEVRGQKPDDVVYMGSAVGLQQVWIAMRDLLELVTVADVAAGKLPQSMLALIRPASPDDPQPGGRVAAPSTTAQSG